MRLTSALWLAPDQVRVITLNDDEAMINYAKPIVAELRANMVRVDSDFSATPFKAKIADACASTTAARKARSRRRKSWRKSWRVFWRASKMRRA